MNDSNICNIIDIIFNNTFTDKNSFLFDNLKLDQFDLTYKNKYILNLVNIFCNKPVYQPFIDTFYLNRKFDFKLNDLFFNEHFIYLFSFCDYFQNNPFIDFDTYISNPDNSIFIFQYFYFFSSEQIILFKGTFDVTFSVTDKQINTFFNDLKFFYNIASKLFRFFQYIFNCLIFNKNFDFNIIAEDYLLEIKNELENYNSYLEFLRLLSEMILECLKMPIISLTFSLLFEFCIVKFLIHFSLSFHHFYLVYIFNDDHIISTKNFYFQPVSNNIYSDYLSIFKNIFLQPNNHTIFNEVLKYFILKKLNIEYMFLYNLLISLNHIHKNLLLPFDLNSLKPFDENNIFIYNEKNKQLSKSILKAYIIDNLYDNVCLINTNLIGISMYVDSKRLKGLKRYNNDFICINNIFDINCLAFNTNLFSITYQDDEFYYINNFHSIRFNKEKFYFYFINLFYNYNFYFFILSPNYKNFNNNKKFLLDLLPYIDYNIKQTFNISLFMFLNKKLYFDKTAVSLSKVCPLTLNRVNNITLADYSLILFKSVLIFPTKYYNTFEYIVTHLIEQNKNQELVFFYLLHVFIYIFIFNTITSYNNNDPSIILNNDHTLVDIEFVNSCAYLFNLYFIIFLFSIVDFSNDNIKIKSYIISDINVSYNKKINNHVSTFYNDQKINTCLTYILNNSFDYKENNDIFSDIELPIVKNIFINVIKHYSISSNYQKSLSINTDIFEKEHESVNDNFNFKRYKILYQI
jgi:hypothetical protein